MNKQLILDSRHFPHYTCPFSYQILEDWAISTNIWTSLQTFGITLTKIVSMALLLVSLLRYAGEQNMQMRLSFLATC